MSNTFQNETVNIGALSNATMPLFKVPAGYSGITVTGVASTSAQGQAMTSSTRAL